MTDLSADLALADAEARASRERVRFEAFISASDDFTHWQLWCAALTPAAPPGWKMVPVEPTPEMVAAIPYPLSVTPNTGIQCYSAMLKAAPSAKEPQT